ncbi:ferritin family protein [Pontibacter flavimaris]|uniref:Rubrerythrin diiron-binding domain-containing protein n=1 Tax=Pontibacter flavimaris TaxID=1797110 RepID=A0A1Q5P8F0_9BACT|nr:hypothetical protein [Pontibacter flavimaris]OKL38527.1 hypothetical protein A3841_05060 [Pontibacter flavimaris]
MAAPGSLPDKKYTDSLQTEVDAGFLYGHIAAAEEVPAIARMFRELGEIEQEHATKMQAKLQRDGIAVALPPPSWWTRVLDRIRKVLS